MQGSPKNVLLDVKVKMLNAFFLPHPLVVGKFTGNSQVKVKHLCNTATIC